MNAKINTCAICQQSSLCEDDHFPVADRHSGTTTWPLCRACHDLTDRIPLYKWSPNMVWGQLISLFEKADRDERLVLVKMFKIAADANFFMKHQAPKSRSNRTKNKPVKHHPNLANSNIDYSERVIASVIEHGPLSRTDIVRNTYGKNAKITKATNALIADAKLVRLPDGTLDVANNTRQATLIIDAEQSV